MRSGKIALVLVMLVAVAAVTHAQQDVQVFVPGNTSGYFGNRADMIVPLVQAITVSGPGTITVIYVSGTVTDAGNVNTGPNGVKWNTGGAQTPLQEAQSVSGGTIHNLDALIGAFVPASRVNRTGFNAIDGTKDATQVGIRPGWLSLIGTGKTFSVTEPGTLFLGINDWIVGDNGGGFNVEVTGP